MYLRNVFVKLINLVKKPVCFAGLVFLLSVIGFAQSTDQNFPTPISTNQINGVIKARDVGDSRLTTYYYVFNGTRGDIFINVVTKNLNGDIDIFTARNFDPQTKITIYADNSDNETGRVIYMRKSEKLILRIQGRSPNDEAATFQIKFAGSFEAIEGVAENSETDFPEVKSTNQSGIKVNSVGTIIEETPKPTPEIKKVEVEETVAEKTDEVKEVTVEDKDSEPKVEETVSENKTETKTEVKPEIPATFDPTKKVEDIIKEANSSNKPQVVITDPFKNVEKNEPSKTKESKPDEVTVELNDKPQEISAIVRIEVVEEDEETVESKTEEANPLAKIFLKVELKNGQKFERPMSEVLSMNIIKGVLTIVTTDGKIQEFSILEVLKTVIE